MLYNDPAALAKAITKRIQALSRGRKFIDYRMSFSFLRDLESIVIDIENGLLENSPKLAFEAVTKFLATGNKVLARVDDSSGEIGGVYRYSVLLWLTTASQWKASSVAGEKINWLERVYGLYLDNDYSVYDELLPNSAILLNHDQLTKLAWRYESELRQAHKAPSEKGSFNLAALNCGVALGSVAEALKDPMLYERATLITSPTPNDMQKQYIVKMYLRFNQVEHALRWLNTPWEAHFTSDRLRLLDEAHLQSGNANELKQTRYQIYQRDKTYSSLNYYLELLNDKEKQAAQFEAILQAEKGGGSIYDLTANVDLLLRLNEIERAESLVLARQAEIENCFYDSLLTLSKQFDEKKCWLAATVCYRGLLTDILNKARTKAYTHAARYYIKLTSISGHIQSYKTLPTHAEFIAQLEQEHGRKRSFWECVL